VNTGKVLLKMKRYDAAVRYFNDALASTRYVSGNVDAFERVSQPVIFLDILYTIAEAHRKNAESTRAVRAFETADSVYQIAIGYIDFIRKSYKEEKSKQALLTQNYRIYKGAIDVNFSLYLLTQDTLRLHRIFFVTEKSRANLLLEAFQRAKASSEAGVPDGVLDSLYRLQSEIAELENKRYQYEDRQDADVPDLNVLNSQIFDLKAAHHRGMRFIEMTYPKYFRLKYKDERQSVAEIQHQLEIDQGLLTYYLTDSSIYTVLITPDQFYVRSAERDFDLDQRIDGLREGLYGYHEAAQQTDRFYRTCGVRYVDNAIALYEKLIQPIEKDLPERLIIIPDGALGYLPFELLLSEQPTDPLQFNSHAYLIRRHAVSYTYSASLLSEMREMANQPGKSLFGIAPQFASRNARSHVADTSTAAPGPLLHNRNEVLQIQKLIGGDVLIGGDATELAFTSAAHDYRILHIATHGTVEDANPDFSFLAFSEVPDTVENEKLFVHELYNLQLQADMVVLSACETGLGKSDSGEGIVSLARGFSYAGAKSLVTTLWSVNDARMAETMLAYYHNLLSRMPKDQALRHAKLAYLKSHDDYNGNPFFWGSTILIGDVAPLEIDDKNYLWWIIAGLAIIVIAGVFIAQGRRKTRNRVDPNGGGLTA
jgi:CHAT domain-containing protein